MHGTALLPLDSHAPAAPKPIYTHIAIRISRGSEITRALSAALVFVRSAIAESRASLVERERTVSVVYAFMCGDSERVPRESKDAALVAALLSYKGTYLLPELVDGAVCA